MADLDLPAGPLVQHLRAAHGILEALVRACVSAGPATEYDLTAHAHHMREVAAYTAQPHHQPPPVYKMGNDRPEGWELLVLDPNGRPLAGWTTDQVFHQWAPTEVIVRNLTRALTEAAMHHG